MIDSAIDTIAGQGGYDIAYSYLRGYKTNEPIANFEIIASRMEFRAGNFEAAIRRADLAVSIKPELDVAVSNSITLHGNTGSYRESWPWQSDLSEPQLPACIGQLPRPAA